MPINAHFLPYGQQIQTKPEHMYLKVYFPTYGKEKNFQTEASGIEFMQHFNWGITEQTQGNSFNRNWTKARADLSKQLYSNHHLP